MDPLETELEQRIEESLKRILENAFSTKPNEDPRRYPGGIPVWSETAVAMGMNGIRQWLHDPDVVEAHLRTLREAQAAKGRHISEVDRIRKHVVRNRAD